MKSFKLIFASLLAAIVLVGCQPSAGSGSPSQNPENGVSVKIPHLYGSMNIARSARNVTVPRAETNETMWMGTGPVLVADWSGTGVAYNGSTFTKLVFGREVVFTINMNEDATVILYEGKFTEDADAILNMIYYTETDTFDLYFRIIYDILYTDNTTNSYAFVGIMKGAQVTDTGYTGYFDFRCYNTAKGTSAKVVGFTYDVTATWYDRVEFKLKLGVHYMPTRENPSLLTIEYPMSYTNQKIWDMIDALSPLPISPDNSAVQNEWLWYQESRLVPVTLVYGLPAYVPPPVVEEPVVLLEPVDPNDYLLTGDPSMEVDPKDYD